MKRAHEISGMIEELRRSKSEYEIQRKRSLSDLQLHRKSSSQEGISLMKFPVFMIGSNQGAAWYIQCM
jgi:hypothetical protein